MYHQLVRTKIRQNFWFTLSLSLSLYIYIYIYMGVLLARSGSKKMPLIQVQSPTALEDSQSNDSLLHTLYIQTTTNRLRVHTWRHRHVMNTSTQKVSWTPNKYCTSKHRQVNVLNNDQTWLKVPVLFFLGNTLCLKKNFEQ